MNLDLLTELNGMIEDLAEEFRIREERRLSPEDVIALAVREIARSYLPAETEVFYEPAAQELQIWRLRWDESEVAYRIPATSQEVRVAEILGHALRKTDIGVAVLDKDGSTVVAYLRGARSWGPVRQRAVKAGASGA